MFSKLQRSIAISACVLIVFALPSGTAAQSIALFLVFCAGLFLAQSTSWSALVPKPGAERSAWIAYSFFALWQIASSLLNPKNSSHTLLQNFIGTIALLLVPPSLALAWRIQNKSEDFWDKIRIAIFVIWTLSCVSQAIVGWQIVGSHIEFSPHYERARGFYSHPLTLAYVLLAIWPSQLFTLWRNQRKPASWVAVVCLLIMFLLSASRTVQVCVAISLVWAGVSLMSGKIRAIFFSGLFAAGVLLIATPNPLSKRFEKLLHYDDHYSDYPDDRLAFWHVFATMIAERPLLGHGIDLDRAYRRPYYEALGLGSFPKQYEAHNQLLQVLAEGGLIGLAAFLAWMFYTVRAYPPLDRLDRLKKQQTLWLLLLAGLSQNAFQDSELRFALVILISLAQAQKRKP